MPSNPLANQLYKLGVSISATEAQTITPVNSLSEIPANANGVYRLPSGELLSYVNGVSVGERNVILSSSNTPAQNTALIQAALDLGGDVHLSGTGDIPISTTLVIKSNTRLSASPGLWLRGTGSIGNILVNSAYLLTATAATAAFVAGAVDMTVTQTAHGLSVGDWWHTDTATDTTFRGTFQVATVTDANTFVVKLTSTSSAGTGSVAGLVSGKKADVNITVTSLNIDYGTTNGNTQSGTKLTHATIFHAISGLQLDTLNGRDTTKFFICCAGIAGGKIERISGKLSSDCVKVYGPSFNVNAENINCSGGDDTISFQQGEPAIYKYAQVGNGGDIINCTADNINSVSNTNNSAAYYGDSACGRIDGLTLKNINGNNSAVFSSIGFSGVTGQLGNITLINPRTSKNTMMVVGQNGVVNIDNLTVINPVMRSAGNTGRFLLLSAFASNVALSVFGGIFQSNENILNINAAVNRLNAIFNGAKLSSVFMPFNISGLNTVVKFIGGLIEGSMSGLLSSTGASANVDFSLQSTVVTAAFSTAFNVGSISKINIRLQDVSFTQDLSGGANNFLVVTGGSPTVNLYCKNVTLSGVTSAGLSIAGTPTINSWEDGLKIDVGLLSLTAGQKAWHSSAVAGRNAANQQGPAFCNGTNWYAIGTGAGGINTLIV